MKRIALAFALLLPMASPAISAPKPIEIVNNRGGNVLQAIQRRGELERSGRPVRIKGVCNSACTIYVTMRNACLDRNATVGFHAPRIPDTTIIPPYVDVIMGEFYRGGIRQRWFGGWNRTLKIQSISAAEYVRLDPQTKICR